MPAWVVQAGFLKDEMALKYKTTKIAPEKSASELQELIRRVGGSQFSLNWDEDGDLLSVSFVLRLPEMLLPCRMEAGADRIYDQLAVVHGAKDRSYEQAVRIAWRHIKHLVEGILLSVEMGITTPQQALLGYVVLNDRETIAEALLSNPDRFKQLGSDQPKLIEAELI